MFEKGDLNPYQALLVVGEREVSEETLQQGRNGTGVGEYFKQKECNFCETFQTILHASSFSFAPFQ